MKRLMLKNVLTTMVCLAFVPGIATAGSLDDALKTLTQEIKKYLDDKGEKQIGIGTFSVPAGNGRLIDRELRQKLKDEGIDAVDEGDLPKWTVRGSVEVARGASQTVTALIVSIFDEGNVEIKGFRERFNEVNEPARADFADSSETTQANSNTASDTAPEKIVPQPSEQAAPVAPKEGAIIDDPVDVARLLGPTVDNERAVREKLQLADVTGPNASRPLTLNDKQLALKARESAITASRDGTSVFHHVSTSEIAASNTSPYSVEILATAPGFSGTPEKGDYLPVPIINKSNRGLPFAEMQKDQIYCVKIYNRSDRPVGVELSIDGINTLELCRNPDFKRVGKYFVNAKSTATFIGWLVDDNFWESFKLTAEPEGLAVELGRVQKIGVISVSFFPTWQDGEPEPLFQRLLSGPLRSISTGRGPVQAATSVSSVRSNFGSEPLSIVTIRYRNPEPTDLPPAEKPAGN